MQCIALWVLVLARPTLGAQMQASGASATRTASAESAITKVVKLLEGMLRASQSDGDENRKIWAKEKCTCDKDTEDYTAKIAASSEEIALEGSIIDELRAKNAILSQEVAELQASIAENHEEQNSANTLFDNIEREHLDLVADAQSAVDQINSAVAELAAVGADQTEFGAAQDHTQYMAGYGEEALLKVKTTVKQALLAASAFVSEKQAKSVTSFLQAPFTETYSAQAGEVVGILKDMRDTFSANIAQSNKAYEIADESHKKLISALVGASMTMGDSKMQKEQLLGSNDDSLATAKTDLDLAKRTKETAEDSLRQTAERCAHLEKVYNWRAKLHAQEEAAISQAIAILNSDAAFESFGNVDATSGSAPSFLQLDQQAPTVARRREVQKLLRTAASGKRWTGLSKVMSLLDAENPFTTVLEAIDKMVALIEDEEKADQTKHDWCVDERNQKNADLDNAKRQISTLDSTVVTLEGEIENLKTSIADNEGSLAANRESQASQTQSRTEENLLYQKDIKNLVEAQDLLTRAITVLKEYYEGVLNPSGGGNVHETTTGSARETFEGQGGAQAITLVEDILTNTKNDEKTAHADEDEAQQRFEKDMEELKAAEANYQDILATKHDELSQKEVDLLEKKEDLKQTRNVQGSIETYLEKIKPGCDFIVSNLAARQANRVEEDTALKNAAALLKDTPAYKSAMAEAHNETLGDCVHICSTQEEHVDCKACLARTSVPGYCAGHPDTDGC